MLYKCANEACSVPFRKLREGKLFQVETEYFGQTAESPANGRRNRPWRWIEHYWLCDQCSSFVTLTFDRERGVITVALPNGTGRRTVTLISDETSGSGEGFASEAAAARLAEVRK
jgi:hypothetical protein